MNIEEEPSRRKNNTTKREIETERMRAKEGMKVNDRCYQCYVICKCRNLRLECRQSVQSVNESVGGEE